MDASRQCQACSEGKQATHECVECAQTLCTGCRETHANSDASKAHKVQSLAARALKLQAAAGDTHCPKHRNQLQLLFCCQCQTIICMVCKMTAHADHATEDLMDTGTKARAELTEELQSLTKREQRLRAFLVKARDFQDDLHKEKEGLEEKMLDRANELRQMVERAHAEALESVAAVTEKALEDLKGVAAPVEERHATMEARVKKVRRVIEEGEDSQAVALLAQMKEEEKEKKAGGGHRSEQVLMERGTLKYELRLRAVKYTNMLAFIGLAEEGPIMEARASPDTDTDALEVSVRPGSRPFSEGDDQLGFSRRRRRNRKGVPQQMVTGRSDPVEIHYSKNPKSTLGAMHLMSTDDDFWLCFNPGGNVALFALFDDDGHMKEAHSENIPSSTVLVTCDGDTVLSMTNGRWVRPGKEAGGVEGFANWAGISVSKSSTPYLLKQNSIFRQLSDALPPQIDANATYTAAGVAMTRFDVSEDGSFVAATVDKTVKVFDKPQGSVALRSYADYVEKASNAPSDVCFCRTEEGKEVLLVAYVALHTVHVLDHRDGCCFIRTLETEKHPLQAPCRLATNHHGRVWVGCNGGKVVIFDV